MATLALLMAPLALLLMRDRPVEKGLLPLGQPDGMAVPTTTLQNPFVAAISALADASRKKEFWILAGSFFICGASTNGLIGTHLVPACMDHGMPEVQAASLLAVMGVFDLVGTTGSGWLSDRFDNRILLFAYYGLRGLSLLYLPYGFVSEGHGLSIFAVFYGLDWIATVPPTVKLTTEAFGRENTGVIYGWIGASHQLGASVAAFGAGAIRSELGEYRMAFLLAGVLCLVAGASFLLLGQVLRSNAVEPRPATAGAV